MEERARSARLAVDAETGEIVASDLTGRRTADCARVPVVIEQIDGRVESVSADGAYDSAAVYEAAQVKGEGHAAWWRIPCTDTRPSSVELCEAEPWTANESR